jgi:hypothetical protein
MAPEEVVVDEFDNGDVVVVEDSAKGLTNALVFMTTLLLVVGIIIVMYAMKKWFEKGMFA